MQRFALLPVQGGLGKKLDIKLLKRDYFRLSVDIGDKLIYNAENC